MAILSYDSKTETAPVWLRMADLPPRLKLSRATLFNMIREGRFPAPVHPSGGRAARWHLDTVVAWEHAAQAS